MEQSAGKPLIFVRKNNYLGSYSSPLVGPQGLAAGLLRKRNHATPGDTPASVAHISKAAHVEPTKLNFQTPAPQAATSRSYQQAASGKPDGSNTPPSMEAIAALFKTTKDEIKEELRASEKKVAQHVELVVQGIAEVRAVTQQHGATIAALERRVDSMDKLFAEKPQPYGVQQQNMLKEIDKTVSTRLAGQLQHVEQCTNERMDKFEADNTALRGDIDKLSALCKQMEQNLQFYSSTQAADMDAAARNSTAFNVDSLLHNDRLEQQKRAHFAVIRGDKHSIVELDHALAPDAQGPAPMLAAFEAQPQALLAAVQRVIHHTVFPEAAQAIVGAKVLHNRLVRIEFRRDIDPELVRRDIKAAWRDAEWVNEQFKQFIDYDLTPVQQGVKAVRWATYKHLKDSKQEGAPTVVHWRAEQLLVKYADQSFREYKGPWVHSNGQLAHDHPRPKVNDKQ